MSLPKIFAFDEITSIAQYIQAFMSRSMLNDQAKALGFIKKCGKLDALDFLQLNLLALNEQGQQCSLTDLCTHASTLGIYMGQQSMNERYNEASVALYKWLLDQLLSYQMGQYEKIELLRSFTGVFVEDATSFQLPDALAADFKGFGGDSTQSAVKLNCKLDLQSNVFRLRLKSATDNDQNGLTLGCPLGSLWLRDLGYYKIDEFINVEQQGAYFISRLGYGTNVYLKAKGKQKIDLNALAKQLKSGHSYEQQVYIGNRHRFACRIVIIKLPKEQYEQRREKLRKTRKAKGKNVTMKRLEQCAINIFITNLAAHQYQADQIWYLYKLRWQIEILFKAWKSIMKLGKIKKLKRERILTQLYINLFQIVITTQLFRFYKIHLYKHQKMILSELKGIKTMKAWWRKCIHAIEGKCEELAIQILNLGKSLMVFALKQVKKHKQNELVRIGFFDT